MMTDAKLKAIENRVVHLNITEWHKDAKALIAEIRRLREELYLANLTIYEQQKIMMKDENQPYNTKVTGGAYTENHISGIGEQATLKGGKRDDDARKPPGCE